MKISLPVGATDKDFQSPRREACAHQRQQVENGFDELARRIPAEPPIFWIPSPECTSSMQLRSRPQLGAWLPQPLSFFSRAQFQLSVRFLIGAVSGQSELPPSFPTFTSSGRESMARSIAMRIATRMMRNSKAGQRTSGRFWACSSLSLSLDVERDSSSRMNSTYADTSLPRRTTSTCMLVKQSGQIARSSYPGHSTCVSQPRRPWPLPRINCHPS